MTAQTNFNYRGAREAPVTLAVSYSDDTGASERFSLVLTADDTGKRLAIDLNEAEAFRLYKSLKALLFGADEGVSA